MKKLMVAAFAVAFAAVAQAASIAWTSNLMSLTDESGTAIGASGLPSGTSLVLVVMTSATGWDSATVIPTATGTVLGTTVMGISTKSASMGRVTGTVSFEYDAAAQNNLINNGDYLALMFQDDEGLLHQLQYTSGADVGKEVTAVYQVAGLSDNASKLTGKAINMTGNFTAETIPEPTSGLLIALGMAALALKRKVA
ncbi:MAG: PEP-CTERM sorting domain-containing protein [Kiritimatiellae bacterium]|nr:PEP-CTERM sorting domain-containing protein [Kiritimatiellia bacterium]